MWGGARSRDTAGCIGAPPPLQGYSRLYRGSTGTTGIQKAVSRFHMHYLDTAGCIRVPPALHPTVSWLHWPYRVTAHCIGAPLTLQVTAGCIVGPPCSASAGYSQQDPTLLCSYSQTPIRLGHNQQAPRIHCNTLHLNQPYPTQPGP